MNRPLGFLEWRGMDGSRDMPIEVYNSLRAEAEWRAFSKDVAEAWARLAVLPWIGPEEASRMVLAALLSDE